jgi:23S rRNA (uracil1939-C5)-methyltransferase
MAQKQKNSSKFIVTISDLNKDGAGIASYKGHTVVVPKTLPGETVLLSYHPERPKKSRLRLKKLFTSAPERVTPPCQYFDVCGGCHLQHMAYQQQLNFKQSVIEGLFQETGLSHSNLVIQRIEGMPEPLHYRNKTQLPLFLSGGEIHYGLYRSGTHQPIPVEYCPVESREANIALKIVRDWARQYRITCYNEREHTGLLRHVVVRKGFFTGQAMVVLVTTDFDIPHLPALLTELKKVLPGLRSVQLNLNNSRTNVILGNENRLLWGENFIEEQLLGLRFKIFPNTFFQINSIQILKVLNRMKQALILNDADILWDIYSGVGMLALAVADSVRHVYGIELNDQAVAAATENARLNQIPNASFICAAATEFSKTNLSLATPTVVIVDPPRKGLPPHLVSQIVLHYPRTVVYLSCNPHTLVRDLLEFKKFHYLPSAVYPFDMFPQTLHIETLCILHPTQ